MAHSLPFANSNHVARIHVNSDTHYVFSPYNVAENSNMGFSEIQEITKKLEQWQFRSYPEKRRLNVEVIDDTALVKISVTGKGKFTRNNCQESGDEKKPKRMGRKGRKKPNHNLASAGKKAVGLVYSREEMEALRYEDLDYQKKKWAEVYYGLGPIVAAEYDVLVCSDGINKKSGGLSFRFDRWPFFQKSANLDAMAEVRRRDHLNIFVQ